MHCWWNFFQEITFCLHILEKLSRQQVPCKCLVPCDRVRYEPSLSYAQLSDINIERLIIDSDKKRKELQVIQKIDLPCAFSSNFCFICSSILEHFLVHTCTVKTYQMALFLFQTKFHSAMEISQRVVTETAEKDRIQILHLVQDAIHLDNTLNASYTIMQSFEKLAAENKAVNVLNEDTILVRN